MIPITLLEQFEQWRYKAMGLEADLEALVEVCRGIMEREIHENLLFKFFVPFSVAGREYAVMFDLRMMPVNISCINPYEQPRLKIVK